MLKILKRLGFGKCHECGNYTSHKQQFADDIDEEGNATGYEDFCCDVCWERLQEIL